MKWGLIACLIFALNLGLGLPIKALAHGAKIEYTVNIAIEIVAAYDDGQPMAGAQVAVYAPDNPSTPWLTGACDDDGRFSFTPDTSKSGTWDVQVRQAGHGDFVHIPVGEDTVMTGGTGSYTILQIVMMSACVVWGFIGTAFYSLRRRRV